MKNVMKKLCSGIMALSIVLTSVNFPARASEPDTGAGMEAENFSEADSLDEFQDAVTDLNEDLDLEPEGKYASRRLIVLSDTDGFDTYGAESVVSFDGIYLLSYASEQDCSSAFRNLSKDSGITSVEVDGVLETGADTDSAGGKETVHQAVDTPLKTYLDTLESTDEVRVAVLDTGIEEEFLELDEVIDTKTNLSNSGNADSVIDDNGHGTEIASIILLNGNENTKVMPVKIANQDGCATVMGAYLGIRQAVENGADIINISMNAKQSVSSQILNKAVDEAYGAGVAVVVSAGNDGINTESITPANIESAIVVSAIDSSNEIASYSNYGDTVDYCSFGDYEGKSGTSYSAAAVSGILANAFSKGLPEEELGEFTVDLWDGEHSDLYGKGLLAYTYPIFEGDDENGDEGETDKDYLDGKDESYAAMMRYVALGDDSFDINTDFANIEFDKSIYNIEFVSCTPEFNVDEEGTYSAAYRLTNRYTGSEGTISRILKVTDDLDFMESYELEISKGYEDYDGSQYENSKNEVDRGILAIHKIDQSSYTAMALNNDYPSADFSENSHLSSSYAQTYIGIDALLQCAQAVEDGKTTWDNVIKYGKNLFNMNNGYITKNTESYTENSDGEYVRKAMGNCPVQWDTSYKKIDCILGCVLAYEIDKKFDIKFKNIMSVPVLEDLILGTYGEDDPYYEEDGYLGRFMEKGGSAGKAAYEIICGAMETDKYADIVRDQCDNIEIIVNKDRYEHDEEEGGWRVYGDGNPKMGPGRIKYEYVPASDEHRLAFALVYDIVGNNRQIHEYDGTTSDEAGPSIFDESYNKYNGDEDAYPSNPGKGVYYKLLLGYGNFYGQELDGAPNQIEFIEDDKYGSVEDNSSKDTYVGHVTKYLEKKPNKIKTMPQALFKEHLVKITDDDILVSAAPKYEGTKAGSLTTSAVERESGADHDATKYEMYVKQVNYFEKPVHMYQGERIFFKIKGKSCGHCGVLGRLYVSKEETDDVKDMDMFAQLIVKKEKDGDSDDTYAYYKAEKEGDYYFYATGAAFACKHAKIYVSTNGTAELFTDNYTITYSAIDSHNNAITYTPPSKKNKTSYNKHTKDFALNNPTKEGWVFDGWSEASNDKVGGTTGKLLGWSKSVKIKEGSYGHRKYIAHFHQPVYTVKHEFEQLDGTFLEKIGERKTFTANTGTVVIPLPLSGNSITGFTAPAPQSITVLADDSATVIYRYTRNSYSNVICQYVDRETGQQIAAPYDFGPRKYGSTVSGAEAPNTSIPDYEYTGDYTIATVGVNGATVKRFYSNRPGYVVKHYLQQKDKSFQADPFEIQSSAVDIGATVTAEPVNAPALVATGTTAEFPKGYNPPAQKNVQITSANQVIRMEYTIKEYQVSCEDYVQGTNTKLGPSSPVSKTYLYGDTASGSDFGSDATIDAYYQDYVYTGSTSITVNDESEPVVKRYFKKADNSYTVHHEYQQQDGSFKEESSDTYRINSTVLVGGQIAAPQRPKTGYINPDIQCVTRQADGTADPNSITYQYELNPNCLVKYIDRVINTERQLAPPVMKYKTFGTTVSGAESGEDRTIGAYYPGYAYVSSTTATVKETGTVVYRDFEDKNTTYTVIHRLQRKSTAAEVFDIAPDGWETLSAVVGDVVTPQPRTKYAEDGYIIPEAQTVTVGADGQTVVTYNYLLADQEAQYTVRHMLQDSDGTYSLYGMPQTFEAGLGSIVTPATLDASEIPGYKIPPQQTITVDGTTGVTYYYDLSDDCAVTCIDIAREDGHQLGTPQVANKTYKTTVYGSDWGSDMTAGRYHDGYVYDGCTNAVVELEGTTVYRYFVLSGSVTPDDTYYQVLHKKQQPDGSYVTADPEAFPAKVGETVRPAPRTYIGYRTPPVQEAVVLADGKTIITYLYDLDVQRARYEVHHYKEQPDGSFQEVLEDAGFFTGMAGEMTDAGPKNYNGYKTPDKINKVIQADGTTRIDYQYRLKTVTVTFIDRVKYTTTNLGSSEEGYRIGTMVSGAMKGTDKTPGAYYDNYVYDSATTATVTADGATVYRYFVLDSTGYKVEHKQQQPDGKYVLAEREAFTGKAGTTVTPETKDYSPAYVSPPEQTVTIAEDGSTVVTYLYDTARYNVTFIDKVKDSEDELGRSVSERAYGSTVSGSEKGTDAGPGKYYEGYTYHSFTSATVRENGTAVYRYFVRSVVKYRVNHIWEQEDGERTTVETKQFRAGAGSEVTPAVNSYDGYDSPEPQTVIVKADGTTVVDYIYKRSGQKVPYTVIHKQEQLDGSYANTDVENLIGKVGSEVTPNTKDYAGFVSPEKQTVKINSDGTTQVIYLYTRKMCNVTYVDIDKDTSKELNRQTRNVKYGTLVAGSDLGDNTTVGYYYSGYSYDSCTEATASMLGTTVYRYFVDKSGSGKPEEPNRTEYRVIHQQEQMDGSYITVESETFQSVVGETVTPAVRQYTGYVSPIPQTVTVEADGNTVVTYKYRIAERKVQYTVIHQQEQADGSYKTVETETHTGIIGGTVTPPVKQYDGFTSPMPQTKVVKEDGSTVITYRYGRNEYAVIYSDVDLETNEELGRYIGYKRYGEVASGAERGESKNPDAYYGNYTYVSCTIETVYASNVIVYRYFKKDKTENPNPDDKKVSYKVIHQQQQLDETYLTVDTETKSGKAGETVTPPIKTYTGFISPSTQTVTINGDGSTVVTYQYRRENYSVRYTDKVKGSELVLGETSMNKLYGETASGSDLGDSKMPGVYYRGYSYDSCTSEVVNRPGIHVFRYFTIKNIEYQVIHQKEQLDGSYMTVETETLEGTEGSTVTPPIKSYAGFTSPEPQTITIQADGTSVVIYKYARDRHQVTYIDKVKDTNTELGRQTIDKAYGTVVMGSDIGSLRTPGLYYKGYVYDSCTIATVGISGATVYRYFVDDSGNADDNKEVSYTVIHQKEQPNGVYVTADIENLKGKAGSIVTPPVKIYEGYISPLTQTVTIKDDGTTVVTYRYKISNQKSGYIVIHQQEQKDGTYKTVETETLSGIAGSTVTPPVKTYDGYISPAEKTVVIAKDGSTVVIYKYTLKDKTSECKVYHEQEQPDGSYEIVEITTIDGNPGEEITPSVKEYEGFESPSEETVKIPEDGNVEVIYRYKRIRYNVVYIDIDKETKDELGKVVEEKPYGLTVSGSDLGSKKEANVYYDGYIYDSCTSSIVSTTGATVYRYFVKDIIVPDKPDDVPYKVIYQEEQPDGTYETVEVEELTGEPGTEVTPIPKPKDGFITPPEETITINPDGTSTVTYKYEREKYDVTYIDIVPDDGTELGKVVEKKPYGTTVAGSDIGSKPDVGAYYEGYSYHSCTNAVVAKSGTVVYRYFKKSEPEDVGYKVITKEEQPDGTYKEVETEIIPGKPGDKVIVTPKPIEGFKTPEPQEVTINPDGSTTVIFEYERESYEVVYLDVVKDTNKELGKVIEKVKFGYTVSGSDKGDDKTADKYYKGYTYDSCTSDIVKISGTTVYRYFVKNADNDANDSKAEYKVYHQEEQPDGSYKTIETETFTGKPGETVTVNPKPREGFKTPKPQTVTINADGSASVSFKYERKSYKVTYIDKVKNNNTTLGKTVENKKYGTVVKGSDKGSSKDVGKYYNGYVYDSCTQATVGTSGTTVYRYFVSVNMNTVTNNAGNADNENNGNATSTLDSGNNNTIQKVSGNHSASGDNQKEKIRTGEQSIIWIFSLGIIFAVLGIIIMYKRKNKCN